MAEANQSKPGSLSHETPRTTGAPVGSTHGGGDGSRAVEEAKEDFDDAPGGPSTSDSPSPSEAAPSLNSLRPSTPVS